MNFNKFINSDYLKNNPLCGIGTYKDELYLATGACTRQIKKLVLTGNEAWTLETGTTYQCSVDMPLVGYVDELSTHYQMAISYAELISTNSTFALSKRPALFINDNRFSTVSDFKAYLAAQYAAGTPVCVWYVLATPTTETITVPSGLSGIEEGYLNQSGTPTPTNPIYPTANTVEKWFDINHYIHNTSTDTITTLPAVLYPNDTTATVGLKGNMSQSGTPTHDNPVMPQGTGERTGNLFPLDESKLHIGRIENDGTIDYQVGTLTVGTDSVTYEANATWRGFYTDFIQANENEKLTFSPNISSTIAWFCNCYDENDNFLGKASAQSTASTRIFTLLTGTKKVRMSVTSSSTEYTISQPMLNLGSTALPYEPFGVKIPISSASTTTPIYLGEVETERQIKKLVLTGEENFNIDTFLRFSIYVTDIKTSTSRTGHSYCSHYECLYHAEPYDNNWNNVYYQSGGTLYFHDRRFATVADFKTYLAQQYTNGTPVTIWYVLATPETAVVNEPLRKIGDYADTLSNVTIPVTAGGDTFSVDTTLQPSEVTVNYKGWHPVADVHERSSGAWT